MPRSTSPRSRSRSVPEDDASVRRRIGPWTDDGLASLDDFDAETNFVVRAAAGSGKTTALVARMVALVRTGVPVDDLTAITFTRKAAGEMSTRFFRELESARAALTPGSTEYERVDRALARVQSAFIGTIHAFCSRLLRERPLAAGLPPDFTAGLDDREERRLRERAWQEHLERMNREAPERIEEIAEYGLDPQDLTSFFDRLCGHAELTPLVRPPESPPDLAAAVEEATERLREWDAHRPDVLPKGRDDVMEAFDKAKRMLRYRSLDTPAQRAAFLSLFAEVSDEDRAKVKVTYWEGEGESSKDWAYELRDERLPSFVTNVVQPVLRAWEATVHEAVVAFTRPAIDRYRSLRREEGLLTFHDLLAATRDLLRDRPGVRREVQERYPILLVDEFQDTDPLQAEILSFLASRDATETDWTACRPRDGSLFIVGDDKQSIYRFRRADKGVFDAFRSRIDGEPNGEAVDLTKNFRSRASICEWCNVSFAAIFDDPEHRDIQADYVPFDPQRPAGPEGTALRRIPLDKVKRNRGDAIAEQDATRIAQFIRAAVAGEANDAFYRERPGAVFPDGAAYSDFLILTRAKTRLGTYTETLARFGIPYTVTGSEDLGASDELRTVLDLLRAARRPDDPVAAVAYLKGPTVGWSDADLYQFRRAGGTFDRMSEAAGEEVLDALEPSARERVTGAFNRLHRVRTLMRSFRPGVGMEKIVEELGLLAGAVHPADQAEASLRAGAMLRIISYVQHLGAQGYGWGEVQEELELIVEGDEALDGMTLETGAGEAVRVMNVHQAKGLEAPVVFLADPYTSGRAPAPKLHLRREEDEIVAPVVQGDGVFERVTHAPLGWYEDTDAAFQSEEERHEAAEERRLLYVAATRAERLLVVSTYPEKPNDGSWSALYGPLDEAEVPALSVPDVAPPTPREVPGPSLEAARREREQRIRAQSRPAYTTITVTEQKGGGAPVSDEDGYGRAYGRALHHLFELCVRHRGDGHSFSELEVRSFLRSEGADGTAEQVERAQSMVDAFRSSWIWDDLANASVVRTEHEFAHAESPTTDEPTQILRGTIDLLYQREGAWNLIDFKTDRVPGSTSSEALRSALDPDHPYRRQVQAYMRAWTEISGEPVGQGGLWFADAGAFVEIESS